jgi:HNH endonuclease
MLDTGIALTPAELRLLACDAGIIPAVLGSPSQVLDLGRATRNFTIAQLRAMAIRDRGCVAPGCDRPPSASQGHHQVTWADGGPTDLANAALLCSFHHHQVHRQHWQVILAANGYPALIPPRSIDPDQRPRQHHRFRLQLLTTRPRT